jgi:anti-sigma regulatory factor (Ser/Thr protein kinase)
VAVEVLGSVRIAVQERSQTAEARRVARSIAQKIGFDQDQAERVAIVVTEACTNLLKHASGGEILLRFAGEDGPNAIPGLEILVLDQGPGMANPNQCLKDGFSTGGSLGQGLGAIVRLSPESDLYSDVSRGTALLARWSIAASSGEGQGNHAALLIGAVNVCKPGQEVCGDSWGVEQTENECVVLVADGLGHGMEAQAASLEAVRMLHSSPELPPGELLLRVHLALRSSRGAAVSVARIDRGKGTLTFAGVGNVSAQIYSGAKPSQHLVSISGTAGHQVQRIREFSYPWPDDGMLVMHSDGLATHTGLEKYSGLALRDPSLIAGVLYRDFTRRNDDATVVVAKVP